MDITVILLALSLTMLVFSRQLTAAWSGNISKRGVLALLVIVLLLVTLNPELRALLLFLDFLGVDVFLILLMCQGQDWLIGSGRVLWRGVMRGLAVCTPTLLPSRALVQAVVMGVVLCVMIVHSVLFERWW